MRRRFIAHLALLLLAGCTVSGRGQQKSAGREVHMHRIETDRLVLRPFAAEDWRDFQELAVDWKAAPGPAFDKWPTSDEACRESVQYMSSTDDFFAMCVRESGKVVGLWRSTASTRRSNWTWGT